MPNESSPDRSVGFVMFELNNVVWCGTMDGRPVRVIDPGNGSGMYAQEQREGSWVSGTLSDEDEAELIRCAVARMLERGRLVYF